MSLITLSCSKNSKNDKMGLIVDRKNRLTLYKAFKNDTEGNMVFPGKNIMGKERDFENTFTDNFESNGPWVIGNTKEYSMSISAGKYLIKNKSEKAAHYSYVPMGGIENNKNWGIEASLQSIEISNDQSFGLVYGMDETSNDKNVFFIDPINKTFSIIAFEDEKWNITESRKNCEVVNKDNNTIRVENIDQFWYYYINDSLVYCKPAGKLFEKKFGFGVDGDGTISVKYFKVHW